MLTINVIGQKGIFINNLLEKILFIQDKQILKKSTHISSIVGVIFALIIILSSPVWYIIFHDTYAKIEIIQEQDIAQLKSLNMKCLDSISYRLESTKNFIQNMIYVAIFIQFIIGTNLLESNLLRLKLHKQLNKDDSITNTRSE